MDELGLFFALLAAVILMVLGWLFILEHVHVGFH